MYLIIFLTDFLYTNTSFPAIVAYTRDVMIAQA